MWNAKLSALKNINRVAYSEWNVVGRPEFGPLWERMYEARKNFTKAIKLNKKQNAVNKLQAVSAALFESNNAIFWKKWNACIPEKIAASKSNLNTDALADNFPLILSTLLIINVSLMNSVCFSSNVVKVNCQLILMSTLLNLQYTNRKTQML